MRHDVWYALRRLRARPWYSAIVVAIFAIGSGAALTVFRIADAVLLRALPYAGAERLVRVGFYAPIVDQSGLPFSDVAYRAMESRNRAFDGIAGYRTVGVNLTGRTTPERVLSARVTGTFFGLLGLPVRLGRAFLPGEEAAKGPTIIILSDGLWRRSFGGDPGVIGKVVRVDGAPATIVGVADPRMTFPAANVGYWTLMDLDRVGTEPFQLWIELLARTRAGTSFDAAALDASRIVREVARENPGPHSTPDSDVSAYRANLQPLRDDMAGGAKPTLALLLVAVGLVLCLTCVNVATLELARASARQGELAVRAALGAGRGRLVFGALIEGAVLATSGCLLGFLISAFGVSMLRALLPAAFAFESGSSSVGVWVVATTMAVVCTLASGAFPVLVTIGGDVHAGLRSRDGGNTRQLALVRRALVVSQIGVAVILVYGASLMIGAIRDAQRVALGFRPEGVTSFRLSLPRESYPAGRDVVSAYRRLRDELRAIPGVTHVALTTGLPLAPDFDDTLLGVEGRPFRADGTDPSAIRRVVSAGYFDALGIPVVAGRAFRESDTFLDGTPIVISQTLAKLLWPDGSDPIGHRLRTGPYAPWMPIIGVVGDVKNRSLTLASKPEIYLPFSAPRSPVGASREMVVVMRATSPLAGVQAAAQRLTLQTNADLPMFETRRLDELIPSSQLREITTARTLAGFALVALALAISGSYAMLMFAVVQRRREFALRHAVGATSSDLTGMIGREMSVLLATGVGIGALGCAVMFRFVVRFVVGVSALDPGVTAMTVLVVAAAGIGAAIIPARRAGAVDPMLVLRSD
jgi:putative ABC transport system permease protein